MSNWIIIVFIIEFALLSIVAGYQHNNGLALYGIGGAVLNLGVLIMGGK